MAARGLTLLLLFCALATVAHGAKPNIVYLLVDDMGYSNTEINNPEAKTPNIKALASSGLYLDRYYVYRFCSPTRSALMTGRLPMHVNQQNHDPSEPGGGVPLGMTTLADKLQSAGYDTHMTGKWHLGMSTYNRLPIARGFNSSFGYLSGAEDHFTQSRGTQCGNNVDLWRNRNPAHGENATGFGDFLYGQEAVRRISQPRDRPFFMYLAFQSMHAPVQAPQKYWDMFSHIQYKPQQGAMAMMAAVDDVIGNVTDALHATGHWNNTLLIFSSDNGGPEDHANNYPLRGSKGTDFEGGTRVNAFLNGGFLPQQQRGKTVEGYMHICDWYATLSNLVGVSPVDRKADNAGLPPIDSLDMWPMLSGVNSTSPRVEIPLRGGPNDTVPGSGLIMGPYKLIRGAQSNGAFPSPQMPNASSANVHVDCGDGCLFNIIDDPTEHHEISRQKPDIFAAMKRRAAELDATYYQSPGADSPDCRAEKAAKDFGDFWGPWIEK